MQRDLLRVGINIGSRQLLACRPPYIHNRPMPAPLSSRSFRVRSGFRRRTRPPMPVKAEDDYLCCFIASHVTSMPRAYALRRLCASIEQQTPSPPPVHVSWSAGSADAAAVRGILDSNVKPWLRQLNASAPCSQFEHLAILVKDVLSRPGASPPAWIMFSDDDDMWSPTRAELYRKECRKADTRREPTAVLLCRRKARPREAGDAHAGRRVKEPSDTAGVHALLASGLASLTDSDRVERSRKTDDPRTGENSESFHRAEYFDFVVRFAVLAEFVRLAPAAMLSHKLCDLGFVRWLRARAERASEAAIRTILPADAGDFVYWYGMALGTNSASQEVDVQPHELELARAARDRTLFATDALAANFLAVLRERLEQELLMLRGSDLDTSGAGIAPRQLIEQMVERQVAALVNAAERTWPPASLPSLRAWALKQTKGPILQRLLRRLEFEAVVCLKTLAVDRICSERSPEAIVAEVFKDWER